MDALLCCLNNLIIMTIPSGGHTINVLPLSMRIPMKLSLTVSNFIILQYTPNPRVSVARELVNSDPMSSHHNNLHFPNSCHLITITSAFLTPLYSADTTIAMSCSSASTY